MSCRRYLCRLAAVVVISGCVLGVTEPAAEPRRFALLIGQPIGMFDDEPLRFAEADAQRVGAVLRDLGDFAPEDVVTLTTTTASQVRRAMTLMNARLREASGDTVLLVFYSGHADADALHLSGTLLPTNELRDLVVESPATVRVLVVDACRSGGVTRRKGGRRAPAFAIDVDERLRSNGVAILTSGAEGEDSQESDALSASFFTHYFVSALRGAADVDFDGRITLVEAFAFASERTIAATSRTVVGPQHPTYRFDLAGREDLVLTRPAARGQRIGALRFQEPGTYLVQGRERAGPILAEIEVTDGVRLLALPYGDYLVTRRGRDHMLQGQFVVSAARTTEIGAAAMERVSYARVGRKGGTTPRSRFSALISAGVRSVLDYLPLGPQLALGVRMDRSTLSFEARLHGAWSPDVVQVRSKDTVSIRELGLSVASLTRFDLGRTTFAIGVEVGGAGINRVKHVVDKSTLQSVEYALLLGAVGQLQHPLSATTYVRAEFNGLAFLSQSDSGATEAKQAHWLLASRLAIGMYF